MVRLPVVRYAALLFSMSILVSPGALIRVPPVVLSALVVIETSPERAVTLSTVIWSTITSLMVGTPLTLVIGNCAS
jgi:hypothetical protein